MTAECVEREFKSRWGTVSMTMPYATATRIRVWTKSDVDHFPVKEAQLDVCPDIDPQKLHVWPFATFAVVALVAPEHWPRKTRSLMIGWRKT